MTEVEYTAFVDENRPGDEYIPLTVADFVRRIRLTYIHISEDGAYSLYYNDGGLFWGHQICVDGDVKSGFARADI